jgi:hypothetical protein
MPSFTWIRGVVMTIPCRAFCAALLLTVLTGIGPASARSYYWNPTCHCWREDTSSRVVREAPVVITRRQIVEDTRIVRRGKVVGHKRVVLHVQPVIKRLEIVHRTNTIIEDSPASHSVHRLKREYFYETVHRRVPGTVQHVAGYRAGNCNCGYRRGLLTSNE